MNSPPLSTDQQAAVATIAQWFMQKNEKQYVTLGGYAGTGKTTLIGHIRRAISKQNGTLRVAFASYTGKAVRVLRSKLNEYKALMPKDSIGTIHSLIYSPIVNEKEEIMGWKRKDKIDYNLIIIDEASMVDRVIWNDLLAYGVPIVAVGDHGQLPPIQEGFNLMHTPMLRLERIHRQAEKNPIIGLSIQARDYGVIRPGTYSDLVVKYDLRESDSHEVMQELIASSDPRVLILCGYNNTRIKLNQHIRQMRGYHSPAPAVGDRLICLRNNHKKNIYNGMTGELVSLEPRDDDWLYAQISMDEENQLYSGVISARQFGMKTGLNFTENRKAVMQGDLFDFGYALTVHKAQGSQAKKVILFEERFPKMTDDQWKRWLYTAVTRAEEELYIFGRNT